MKKIKKCLFNFYSFILFLIFLFCLIPNINFIFSASLSSLSQEKILLELIDNLINLKSGSFNSNSTIKIEYKNGFDDLFWGYEHDKRSKNKQTKTLNLNFNFDVYFNLYDSKNRAIMAKITVNISSPPEKLKAFLKSELIYIDGVFYFNLKDFKLPFVDDANFNNEFSFIDKIFKPLTNQWIKVSYKDLIGDFDKVKDSIDEQLIISSENLSENINLYDRKKFLSEMKVVIKNMFRENVISLKRLADQRVDGVNSYRYRILINKNKLKNFIFSYIKKNNKNLDQEELKYLKENLDRDFSALDIQNFEIWISKKDLLLTKIFLVLNVKKRVSELDESDFNFEKGQIKILFKFKDLNKPIVITPPQQAKSIKSLEDLLNNLLKIEFPSTFDSSLLLFSTSSPLLFSTSSPDIFNLQDLNLQKLEQ